MIEIRKDCKVCGGDLPNSRYRTFCSDKCRWKFYNKKYAKRGVDWQRAKRDKEASIPNKDKKQCLICKKWYVQVCSHVYQVHGLTGREYRERFGLDVKKGVIPKWYRKKKGDKAVENKNKIYKNLEAGKKFRFVKGDKKAGRYKRSKETMERLKKLHKFNK